MEAGIETDEREAIDKRRRKEEGSKGGTANRQKKIISNEKAKTYLKSPIGHNNIKLPGFTCSEESSDVEQGNRQLNRVDGITLDQDGLYG